MDDAIRLNGAKRREVIQTADLDGLLALLAVDEPANLPVFLFDDADWHALAARLIEVGDAERTLPVVAELLFHCPSVDLQLAASHFAARLLEAWQATAPPAAWDLARSRLLRWHTRWDDPYAPPTAVTWDLPGSVRPMSSFRAAVEAKDPDAMAAALHPDVRFFSPAVFTPYEGRDTVMGLLRHVLAVFEDFRYTDELAGADGTHGLVFAARVGEKEIQGWDYLTVDADGLVTELTVMIRPLKGLITVAEAMGARIAAAG